MDGWMDVIVFFVHDFFHTVALYEIEILKKVDKGPLFVSSSLQTEGTQSALHFVKLMVGFQFHFNRCNGVEKIVDEKNDNIHTYIHTYIHTSARTK